MTPARHITAPASDKTPAQALIGLCFSLLLALYAFTSTDGRTTGFAYDALNRRVARSIPVQGGLAASWAGSSAVGAESTAYNAFGDVTAILGSMRPFSAISNNSHDQITMIA